MSENFTRNMVMLFVSVNALFHRGEQLLTDFAQAQTNSHFVALMQSFLFSAEVYERAHVRDSVFDLNVN